MSVRKTLLIIYRSSWVVFFALVVLGVLAGLPFAWFWVWLPALLALAIFVAGSVRTARLVRRQQPREAVEVDAPVRGRWSALNSPADRTPSHGTHGYGQTYAIDLVAEPAEGARPGFRALWPLVRRSRDFPAFGEPLFAVADATVVHADDRQRDHLSRNSLPAVLYLLIVEASFRDLCGVRGIFGNHVVLDLGDGVFAAYAHLQRGSLAVRRGDRVRAGQLLARCGNSGNSSEPHLHFQLMDGPDADTAVGIPFRWRGLEVPGNGELFTAGETVPGSMPTP
ncbi:M23 family metallopeptidase [Streptomyces sp. ISL-10]|uniref:M23 family metallopeptidase n=1 Tax=Streptomyces sp. ISL-10 TaxID=2819172 RepID=UPI001BEC6C8F|nr:M23 family metallopeptidase [Streptomyces sp. ISL-10]MBT2369442.1 M23 family metallopeptidase [Streptomyces sp. ISL-10]